jgi:hypothetical protein
MKDAFSAVFGHRGSHPAGIRKMCLAASRSRPGEEASFLRRIGEAGRRDRPDGGGGLRPDVVDTPIPPEVVLEPELVLRDSTGPAPLS